MVETMLSGYIFELKDNDVIYMYIPGMFTTIYDRISNGFNNMENPEMEAPEFIKSLRTNPDVKFIYQVNLPFPDNLETTGVIPNTQHEGLEKAIHEKLMEYK